MVSSTSKCRGCLNKANSFCYACGDFTTVAQRRTIPSLLRTAYFHYFDSKIGDQEKFWTQTSVVNPATMEKLHDLMARKPLSTLQSRCFGESRETTQMIVIFV